MSEEIRIVLKDGEAHPISDFDMKETIDILHKAAESLTNRLQANTLDPCPFCDAEISVDDIHYIGAEYSGDNFLSQVVCPECGAGGPIGYTGKRAAEHWNLRKQKGNNDENQ